MKKSAQVVILNKAGLVLGVSRKTNHNDFGLPGGKVDPEDKDEMAAAIREVKEETGLDIYDLQLVFVMHKNGYMGYTYIAKYSGRIKHNEPHVVKWVPFDVIMRGSFGKFNKLVAESLNDMGVKFKETKRITLFDKIKEVFKTDEWANYHYEIMIESHQKYLRAILTDSDMGINGYSESVCEKIMEFAHKNLKESEKAEKKLLKIINSKIKLKKIKSIHGYTEFDILEWDFKSNPTHFLIKYRPKNVPVSFWSADPKDICYEIK